MQLSDLLTKERKYSKAIIAGRFAPFTKGHLKLWEYAKSQGYDDVYIGVCYRNKPQYDVNNPFTTGQRIEFAKRATGAKVFQINGLSHRGIYEVVGEEVAIVVGQDRTAYADNTMSVYEDAEIVVCPRSDEDISATKVRNALLKNDEQTFRELMPESLHSFFGEMRKIITEIEKC